MKKRLFTICWLISLIFITVQAQDLYRSVNNNLYWKNRPPFPGYWQQDVSYFIKATLNDTTDIIDASEVLTYYNNSPDSLPFVYFHLYQNAFQPESYLDNLQKNNKVNPVYGKYESQKLGTHVEWIETGEKRLKTQLDNTILKVYLTQPLKSGDSITFRIKFKTYFDTGSTRRRMKTFKVFGSNHYDGVLWYPRICVYDRKFGWATDQHLNREFYGDFGSFEVELTLPRQYIIEATGELQNTTEVLPDSLRQKLDIKNFAKKPMFSKPSVIIPPDGTYKTWKYKAVNVHDFAFTADPTYRIGEAEWNGIKCIAVVQEPNAARWQNAASYTSRIIKTYSTDIGMYAYPKMVVADARDGMEYPMLTLDNGWDPSYRYLLCHEIGHNWFYGMVGNNETYRAALDEGFTQFLTVWALNKLEGQFDSLPASSSKYVRNFTKYTSYRDKYAYLGYIRDAIKGEDAELNTHSDYFNGALGQGGGYRQVYSKTATMLYNLQYVLGDSLFLKAMQHYFSQWKICHPYLEDFRNSIIHFTHVDLNWFFDQWLETTKKIDYSVKNVKKGQSADEYIITFERKERMQMPIDFQVESHSGKLYNFHIPNTWFIKKTNAAVLDKWTGWDKLFPTYEAHVTIPEGINNVIIDSTGRLADINLLDNSYKFPLDVGPDAKVNNTPSRYVYELKARPDLWYNAYDGIKAGFHANGSYLGIKNILEFSGWVNTSIGQQEFMPKNERNKYDPISFRVSYKTPIDRIINKSNILLSVRHLDGLDLFTGGLEKYFERSPNTKVFLFAKSMRRPSAYSNLYLLYPQEWEIKKYNNSLNSGIEHLYIYPAGKGKIEVILRSTTLGSDFNYNYITLKAVNNNSLGKLDINTRTFIQYGKGSSIPKESALFLAGANPEELMENKFTRARGFFDQDWMGYGTETNHFQMGGGLNLRGYAGYLAPQFDSKGDIVLTYRGTSGASESIEVGFDRFIPLKPKAFKNWLKINTYIFADGGWINYNKPENKLLLSDFRADAGLGTTFTIKKWGPLYDVKPFTIRFDFPFYLSNVPATEEKNIQFRWLVGVNRSF